MDKYLYELFDELKISQGDTLFISSDFQLLAITLYKKYRVILDLNKVINYFQERITLNGTIVIPTYSFAFCRGEPFYYRTTKSDIGSMSNVVLARKDFVRTLHPIYNFCFWGKDSLLFKELDYIHSYGSESVFEYLYKNNTKNLFVNVPFLHSATFAHYVEYKCNVPYRFTKSFTGMYTDKDGVTTEKTYSIFVKYLDNEVNTRIEPLEEIFRKNGCILQEYYNSAGFIRLIDYKKTCDIIEDDIKYNNAQTITY